MPARDIGAIKARLGILRSDLVAVQEDPSLSASQRHSAVNAIFAEIVDLHVRWGEAIDSPEEPLP